MVLWQVSEIAHGQPEVPMSYVLVFAAGVAVCYFWPQIKAGLSKLFNY